MDEFLQYLEGMDDPLLTATNKIKELLQEIGAAAARIISCQT